MGLYRSILFSLIILFAGAAHAQQKVNINQSLIWYGGSIKKQLENGYAIALKVDKRDFIFPHRQQQLVMPDINLSKNLKKGFKVDVGLWVFTIYQPGIQEQPVNFRQYEWRPYFTVYYKQTVAKGNFDFYIRSEYRGFNDPLADNRFEEAFDTYAIRERFLVRYNYPVCKNLTARVGEELHINVANNRGQGAFDQNRIMGDFVYSIGFKESYDQLKLHAGYMHWYQAIGGNRFFSHHIITTGVDIIF